MSSHIHDIHVVAPYYQFYFIKAFRLEQESVWINSTNYWRLNNDDNSFFNMSGYLRKLNDSIMLVPMDYDRGVFHEYKLFDFNAARSLSWKLIYKTMENGSMMGDSIVLDKIVKSRADTVYTFILHDFLVHNYRNQNDYDYPVFDVDVSKRNGIISINARKPFPYTKGFDYKAKFYPRQIFIDDRNYNLLGL